MSAAPLLTILKDGETLRSHSIEDEALLGRAEGCLIRLDDRAISREHFKFKRRKEGLFVEKKSQFSPLVVNGAEVEEAVLKEGDVISIGRYLLRLSQAKGGAITSDDLKREAGAEVIAIHSDSPARAVSESLETGDHSVDLTGFMSIEEPVKVEPAKLESESLEAQPDSAESAPVDFSNGTNSAEIAPNGTENEEFPLEVNEDGSYSAPESGAAPASGDFAVEEDAKTKLTGVNSMRAMLLFKDGAANVSEFELSKQEIFIGRSKNCDVVLYDKRASRKHISIRKLGNHFIVKDLDTVNGTYVNGHKITEAELSGEDVIRIGDTDFQLKAESTEYSNKQASFLQLPSAGQAVEEAQPEPELAFDNSFQNQPVEQGQFMGAVADPQPMQNGAMNGFGGIDPSITTPKSTSLFGRFKEDPDFRKKLIYGAVVLCLGLLMLDDNEKKVVKKPVAKPVVVANQAVGNTYESLSPEKKKFVDTTYELGYTSYQQRDYDKAIESMMKVHALIPEGFKQSKEIERYAREGQAKLRAMEEERKRKEEEEKRKAKIHELVEEGRGMMAKKQYDAVKPLMERILELDPENINVAQWKKEIEAYEEKIRTEENAKRIEAENNKRTWEKFQEGMALKKAGKFYSAIDLFKTIPDYRASDIRVNERATKEIANCYNEIKNRREPILVEAREKEKDGKLNEAFKLYRKATIVDPPHKEGYRGMTRIRQILNDRAKIIYTEAILAESYSDFTTAKKRFEEVLTVAPEDDVYYGRAQRKLKMYINPRGLATE